MNVQSISSTEDCSNLIYILMVSQAEIGILVLCVGMASHTIVELRKEGRKYELGVTARGGIGGKLII